MQIANNNQVEDFLMSNGTVIQDFSGKILEMKYTIKSENDFRNLLQNKESIGQNIEHIRRVLRFSKIICRFYFGKFLPNMEQQKTLILFQEPIFDEVTVQMIHDDFDSFKIIYEYAHTITNKLVSALIDPILNLSLLNEITTYLAKNMPSNTRWLYHKLSVCIDRLRYVSRAMQNLGIAYYLTGCNKRYGGDNEFRNLDISTICKGYFGFNGCCLDYSPAPINKKGKKKGFAIDMDSFNADSYEWEKTKNGDYRKSRTQDFIKLDKTSPNQAQINNKERVRALFRHLDTLSQ